MAVVDDALWSDFERFVAADTSVLRERNHVPPQDPRVAAFAADVAAPALGELGAQVEIDALNNVLATFGPRSGRELLFMCYPVTHHGNEMDEPLRAGRRTLATGEEVWRGLGASQGKAGLAAVCAAVRAARDAGAELDGAVAVAVNSEGSSSHESSRYLYDGLLARRPAGAILAMGTENKLVLGNRGRVDVVVEVPGKARHSSRGGGPDNPIERVAEVLERLAALELTSELHPQLGARALVPYKLTCGPIAPHTIPSGCTIVVDRRLLPGDDVGAAVDDVRRALEGLEVSVERSVAMLPALVTDTDPLAEAIQSAAVEALGRHLEVLYPAFTFDSGYGCSIGVPSVMLGPSTSDTSGDGVLGEDFVGAGQLRAAVAIYRALAEGWSRRVTSA